MTGKAYTMKEMKMIVDYIVEHKAYSEIRGRKMWTTFAGSQLTTRTWQSLKETFIKRILPDIANPYYKLTMEQMRSFKQGCDVAAKERNKLDIVTVSDDSNSNNAADNQKNGEQPSTSNGNKEMEIPSGEDIISAKIASRTRSSTDTLVLEENFYSNAEEIQNVLENMIEEKDEAGNSKPLKDCFTFEYSDPVSVDAINVLNDFATDSENSDKDPPMEIVENIEEQETNGTSQEEIVILEAEEEDVPKVSEEVEIQAEKSFDNDTDESNHSNTSKTSKEKDATTITENTSIVPDNTKETSANNQTSNDIIEINTEEAIAQINESENPATLAEKSNKNETIPSSDTQITNKSADSVLPNNQEALNGDLQIHEKSTKKTSRKRSTSQDSNKNKKCKLNDDKNEDNKVPDTSNEVVMVTVSSENTEELFNAILNQQDKVNSTVNTNTQNEDKNPCLQSVSLFAEQFNTTKYSDSESDQANKQTNKPEENVDKNKNTNVEKSKDRNVDKKHEKNYNKSKDKHFEESKDKDNAKNKDKIDVKNKDKNDVKNKDKNDFKNKDKNDDKNEDKNEEDSTAKLIQNLLDKDEVLSKSHSESDKEKIGEPSPVQKSQESVDKSKTIDKDLKARKQSAVAHMLGFSGGGASRKRRLSHKRPRMGNTYNISESSEWTSESDEYVSPPRGRRNKHAKKYLKPKSAKILSLNEEGGLFVMHGKKIYPVVKDGKVVKNYVALDVDNDSADEINSYWRMKYQEEKKRADELEKRLNEANTIATSRLVDDRKSPILQSNTLGNKSMQRKETVTPSKVPIIVSNEEINKEPPKLEPPQEKLKITFTRNNEEVHLEGTWAQLNPALQQVVQIFHSKNDDSTVAITKKPVQRPSVKRDKKDSNGIEMVEIDSGKTTPIIPTVETETHEKVNKIESEIFKEIESLAEIEKANENNNNSNVTKRAKTGGKPKRQSKTSISKTSNAVSRATSPMINNEELASTSTKETSKGEEDKIKDTENDANNDEIDNSAENILPKRKSRMSRKGNAFGTETRTIVTRSSNIRSSTNKEEEDVRYMLPQTPERVSKRSKRRSMSQVTQDPSLNSIESSLGYQDSDITPVATIRKRKYTLKLKKPKKSFRSKSLTHMYDVFSADSNNSSYFIPLRKTQSTINSSVYRTESYNLLMPLKNNQNTLAPIHEKDPLDVRHFNSVSRDKSNSSNIIVEVGSSSNISLPPSPELSVVENLTVSRDKITNSMVLNDTQTNVNDKMCSNKYMISDFDVSRPLMGQDCALQKTNDVTMNTAPNETLLTQSLITKIDSVTMKEPSISDTIDKKLQNLLLESAKKISEENRTESMEVVETVSKKTRSQNKKRCSTPRKKKTAKSKVSDPPIIEEEHMETCSFSGRKSCPPIITVIPDEISNLSCESVIDKRGKKKKDIIKVKILKPKNRKSRSPKDNTSSICTDSGINETNIISTILKGDSVELIHNHSMTCLHANECIGDSVEIIENSTGSIFTLNSTSTNTELLQLMDDVDRMSAELDFSNAQDVPPDHFDPKSPVNMSASPAPVDLRRALTNSSLITEDLSNEPPSPPTKWYLFSDDETTTNKIRNTVKENTSFGSNLNQIFTSYAIPNLSTITERSTDSRKVNADNGESKNCDSQNLF